MKLRLDTSKAYAIALEGGGAKGAYEVGVWRRWTRPACALMRWQAPLSAH